MGTKALIADDSSALRARLRSMLTEVAAIDVVGEASDVQEAKEEIARCKPDVVILDIRMPGGSGIDVLQEAKQQERPPKVIVLTNYPYPQYRRRCEELGADYFLDKSTEFTEIPKVLGQLADKPRTAANGSA